MTTIIKKYNPGFLTDEELLSSFCVRIHDYESILETLRTCTTNANTHTIVIDPRGSGKTHLLLRIAAQVRRDATLACFYPIIFAEESYEVTTCSEFLLECLERLAYQAPEAERAGLHLSYNDIRNTTEDRVRADRGLGSLLNFADRQGQRLLLIAENLNMLFAEMADPDAGWQLRKILQTGPRILLHGAPHLAAAGPVAPSVPAVHTVSGSALCSQGTGYHRAVRGSARPCAGARGRRKDPDAGPDAHTGRIQGPCPARHRHPAVREFRDPLAEAALPIPEGHVILDTCSTHQPARGLAWLADRPHGTFPFTPTARAWLHAGAGFLAKLSRRLRQRGILPARTAREAALQRFLTACNATEACAFPWRAAPDEIIAAHQRGYPKLQAAPQESPV